MAGARGVMRADAHRMRQHSNRIRYHLAIGSVRRSGLCVSRAAFNMMRNYLILLRRTLVIITDDLVHVQGRT